ncbi:MAG: hypothetical protein V4565_05305 [Bacteroidota bacterium]
MKLHLIIILIIFFFATCQKKDNSSNITISGNVRNNCTGYGFKNVTVNFKSTAPKSSGTLLTTTTDNNGNFSFENVEINSNSNYKYFLSVPSYSNPDYEFFGIGSQELNKEEVSNPYQIGVSASFKALTIQLPQGTTVILPDSFNILLEQKTLHQYEPLRVWQIPYDYGTIHNYPMGWWHITLNKTKSGVNSVVYDSVFVDMGGTAIYTIPW